MRAAMAGEEGGSGWRGPGWWHPASPSKMGAVPDTLHWWLIHSNVIVDCIDNAIDIPELLGLGRLHQLGRGGWSRFPRVSISALRTKYAEPQCIHVALLDIFQRMLELAVWIIADTLLEHCVAGRHALLVKLVKKATLFAFHTHTLHPKRADCLFEVADEIARLLSDFANRKLGNDDILLCFVGKILFEVKDDVSIHFSALFHNDHNDPSSLASETTRAETGCRAVGRIPALCLE